MNNGRVEFSQLRTGTVRGYSFNLVDVGIGTPISSMEQTLIEQVEDTVRQLEGNSGRRIAWIYIGKTFIPRRRAPGGRFVLFSYTNPNTWRMTGISYRWHHHRQQDYGRDGLVVLCAVTRDNVPNKSPMSREQLALAIEQRLLHHYRLAHPDERFANETFPTGPLAQHNYHAYAVYMAFRYADEEHQETPNEAAHNQPHDLTTALEEADEDMLLGPDSPTDDDSPIDDRPLDSPHEMEAQNDPLPVLVNEMGEDTLLEDNFPQTDSPPDGLLLDSPPTSPLLTNTDNPGPNRITLTAAHSPYSTTSSDSSSVLILDDEPEHLPIVITDNEPHTISSDSESESEHELVDVPQRYRQ